MELTVYPNASDWLADCGEQLYEDEPANSLILGIAHGVASAPEPGETKPYFVAVREGKRCVAAALMTPPRNIVFSAHSQADPAALALLVRDLLQGHWPVPGVLAPPATAATFAEAWSAATGQGSHIVRHERAFELRQVIAPHYSPGALRLANRDDLDLVARWVIEFQVEAMGEDDPEGARAVAGRMVGEGNAFLWEDGRPVSIAARARPTRNGISISMVYTPPEYRCRGYASSCVARLSRYLLDSGYRFCTLNTDLANPTSNHIYQAIGYRPVCDYDELCFGPVSVLC